ncbi:MAG TPA: AMP-binding protein, partial [Candidatus Acidoferrales bacterium]|nr:AMP-binding protein [Candidatus Acidoferrales bacterium]
MVSPARQFDAVAGEERVLAVVRELLAELGHASALRSAGPTSHLDRDLGLGSLERVELLLRLEKSFGTRLDEDVLAGAETVQDLILAVGAASGADSAFGVHAETAVRAAEISFTSQAQGIPAAETFQDVLRHRGRADASRTHLIFYEDDTKESPSLTFGELLQSAERVAAALAQRGIGRGDKVALMLPTSRDFFLT